MAIEADMSSDLLFGMGLLQSKSIICKCFIYGFNLSFPNLVSKWISPFQSNVFPVVSHSNVLLQRIKINYIYLSYEFAFVMLFYM